MGFPAWGTDSKQYKDSEEVKKGHHAKLSHEVIAGAASFEAAKLYEDHVKKNGKPPSHAKAKEVFAGLTGVAATHLFETKGLNAYDKAKVEKDARGHASEHLAKNY
ncbi:putative phosphoglycerate mutase family protein [Amanita muscaria]